LFFAQVFDLTNVTAPSLFQVFHLSPASETLNPGLAYENRTLGEIDPESIQFLSAEDSPTGKPAVLFSGAWSGTASLWEFTCPDEPLGFFGKLFNATRNVIGRIFNFLFGWLF